MKLSHLTDKSLLNETKSLVMNERSNTLQVLHHLSEIDKRNLYSDLKFGSLFEYCVKDLGYSEGAAQRRIVAARLLYKLPEIGKKIETGKLSLTNIAEVTRYFKDEKSQRKVLIEVEGLSKKDCEKKIFEISGIAKEERESKKRISKDKIQIAIVLNDTTHELMEKVKNLLGKDMSADDLIAYAMEAAIKKIQRTKFAQTKSRQTSSPSPAKVGRYIQAKVKRSIYQRDQKCTNCGSQHNLNFDHRQPYSLGGTSGIENIRILCFNCNQRARMRIRL